MSEAKKYDKEEHVKSLMEMLEKGELLAPYNNIEYRTSKLSGVILTIIDSAIPESKQNKAIKDLVKKEIREYLFKYQEELLNGGGHSVDHLLEDKTPQPR